MKLISGRPLQAIGLLVFLYACGSDSPTTPVVTVTPTPVPTPTPTPALGSGFACGVPAMPECGRDEGPPGVYGCCTKLESEGNGHWDGEIWDAINIVQTQHPELFRGQNILDRVAFINEVAKVVESKYKLCAKFGAVGDEIGLKINNTFSEQYDIYESNGRIRYPGYAVTCRPARF